MITGDPLDRYARVGLWGLPIFVATLFAGTITHQPPRQTDLADWSRFVTTNEFLFSHIVFSIAGSVFGAIGSVWFGIVLVHQGELICEHSRRGATFTVALPPFGA